MGSRRTREMIRQALPSVSLTKAHSSYTASRLRSPWDPVYAPILGAPERCLPVVLAGMRQLILCLVPCLPLTPAPRLLCKQTRETTVVLRGVTVSVFENFQDSSSPALRLVLGPTTATGAGPPLSQSGDGPSEGGTATPAQTPSEGVPPTFVTEASEDEIRRNWKRFNQPSAAPSSAGCSHDPTETLPITSPPLSPLLEYQLYRSLHINVQGISAWVSVSTDPDLRRKQACDDDEKILDHPDDLAITYQQLRLPEQFVLGKPLVNTVAQRRLKLDIDKLPLRLYPSQLRALFHIYLQSGFRLLKLLPGLHWNHPQRDLQVYKLSEPWNPWAQADAEPKRWPLKMQLEVAVSEVQFTLRGYRLRPQEPPPNLLYVSASHLIVDRMTDAIDQANLSLGIDEIHAYMNDDAGDSDVRPRPGWSGRRDCRHCVCSLWKQELQHRTLEETLMNLHVHTPVVQVTQKALRSCSADRYDKVITVKVQPQLEVSLPSGGLFGPWCDLVLNAWHAVEVEEDMSAIPEIFDLPCANVVNLHIPRVALTIHTDASSAGQFRDEDPSCLVLNVSKLRYTREWDPPCVTRVRQTIKVGEVSIWDFGRSVGSKCRGKQEQQDGLCVLLISASEAAGEAYQEGLLVELTKNVDSSDVYRTPYAASPPHAWPRMPQILSKKVVVRASCVHAALANDFVDQVLWYLSHLEAASGPSMILGPQPNSLIVPGELDLALDNVRVVLPAGPTMTSAAAMIQMRQLIVVGELSTMELGIMPVSAAISSARLNLESGPYGALQATAVEQIVASFTADLAIRVNEEQPHRRIVIGTVPVLDVEINHETAALLWLLKELIVTHPFLMTRTDPDFIVPSKWDIAIDIAGIQATVFSPSRRTGPMVRVSAQQLAYTRDFKTDVITIASVDVTSQLVPDSVVAVVGGDDKTGVVVVLKKKETPCMEVTVDSVNARVTGTLMAAVLEFHDCFLPMLPTSASRSAYNKLVARACRGHATHVFGRAWQHPGGDDSVLASCPRPSLFQSMVYTLMNVRVTLVGVGQMRISKLAYSKTRPDIAAPTLISKQVVIERMDAWSVAGLASVGTWIAEEKLARVLTISPDSTHEAGVLLEMNETLPLSACPWMSQQSADCATPSMLYRVRGGSILCSLQNEFLQPLFAFFDALRPVVHASREDFIPDRNHRNSTQSWSEPPETDGVRRSRASSVDSAQSFHSDPHDLDVPGGGEVSSSQALELDLDLRTFQIAFPVGFQEVVRRSQTNLETDSVPERHCLLIVVDNCYAVGMLHDELQFGTQLQMLSGTIGSLGSATKAARDIHDGALLRAAQPVMAALPIAATVSNCTVNDTGETRRILRSDLPQITFSVDEMQYAVAIAIYDMLVASPMMARKGAEHRAAPTKKQSISAAPLDIEIGIKGVAVSLTRERTGDSLLCFSCSPIDISRQNRDWQVHLGKISATTHHRDSMTDGSAEFPLLTTAFRTDSASEEQGGDRTYLAVEQARSTASYCRIWLRMRGEQEQPTLDVSLGDTDITVLPEFAKSALDFVTTTRSHYAALIQSKDDIEAALKAAAAIPRRTDIVIEDNEIVTEDLTLMPSSRLFFRPTEDSKSIKLTGNGFSLRFEGDPIELDETEELGVEVRAQYDENSPAVLFVPAGVTLYLVDMVLENFHKNAVSLGDNAQVKGVVELANPVSKVSLRGSRASASPFARRLTRSISVMDTSHTSMNASSGATSGLLSPGALDGPPSPRDPMFTHDGADSTNVPVQKEMLVLHLLTERVQVHALDSIFSDGSPRGVASPMQMGRSRSDVDMFGSADGLESWGDESPGEASPETPLADSTLTPRRRFSRGMARLGSLPVSKPRLSKLKLSQIGAVGPVDVKISEDRSYSTFDVAFRLSVHVKPTPQAEEDGDEAAREPPQVDPSKPSDFTIKVDASDVSVSTTTRMDDDGATVSRAEIIAPTGLTMDICVNDDLTNLAYEMDVAVDPVTINLAFSTLQLAMLFGRVYTAMLRADADAVKVAVPVPAQSTARAGSQAETKRSIRLQCPFVKAQLVDDSQASGFPLLQCTIQNIDVETGIHREKDAPEDDEYTSSKLTMRVSADSMNNALAEWEPLMEPCSVLVEAVVFIKPQTAASVVGDTEVSINATDTLNVNITRKMLQAMQTAAVNWKAVVVGPRLAISNSETSYKLRNETAGSVTLWLPDDETEGVSSNPLAPGEELAFNLAARGIQRMDSESSHSKVLVGLPGYTPIMVDLDRVGFYIYRFESEDMKDGTKRRKRKEAKNRIKVACNLFLDGPTKVASLRAVLFVENDTEEPIQLTVNEPPAEDVHVHRSSSPARYDCVTIRPGGGTSIDAGTRQVWMRPSEHFKWAAATVPSRVKEGRLGETAQTVSRARNLAAGIVAYAIAAESTNSAVSLHVMPTLAIHNRLPCVMSVRVYRYENLGKTAATIPGQREAALTAEQPYCVWEGSLRPGGVTRQCCGSRDDHMLISVMLDGFTWSPPALVESPVHFLAKTLEVLDSKKRVLSLGVDNRLSTDERSLRSVIVFCNCWIVNLTGLPLLYSEPALVGSGGTAAAGEPLDGNPARRPVLIGWARASFKVADTSGVSKSTMGGTSESEWSKAFSTTAIRTSGVSSVVEKGRDLISSATRRSNSTEQATGEADVEASIAAALQMGRRRKYDICVTVSLGKGKYRRTKVVRLEPQFMLHNRVSNALVYKQADTDYQVAVDPKASSPIWWSDFSKDGHLCFRSEGAHSKVRWSAPVDPRSANNTVIAVSGDMPTTRRRRRSLVTLADANGDEGLLVRVDSQERGRTGGISVVVRDYNPNTPGYLIENHSAFELQVWQEGVKEPRKMSLAAHRTSPYIWQVPLGQHAVTAELISANPESKRKALQAFNINFEEFKSSGAHEWEEEGVVVKATVRPRGPTKVLRISSRPVRRRSSDVATIVDPEAVKSTKLGRALGKRKLDFMTLTVAAPRVVCSLIDYRPNPVEVFAMCLTDLSAMGEMEVGQDLKVDFAVGVLQMDNGNIYSTYPVILSPAVASSHSFIQVKATKSLRDNTLNSYPYLSVMIQEANLALDDAFLASMAAFVTGVIDGGPGGGYGSAVETAQPTSVSADSGSGRLARAPLDADIAKMVMGSVEFDEGYGVLGSDAQLQDALLPVHCDFLEVHPICVNITFAMTQAFDETAVDDPTKAFRAFAGILGVTIANIDSTPIKLNCLKLENVFSTQKQLMVGITDHYTRQVVLELYKILGSADLIGNPIGLVTNLATGVSDFFYEPAKAVFHNPLDLGEGLRKGTASLLSHSIHGSFNTVSKITGTFGKGMAALTMDDNYLAGRKKSKRRATMQSDHLDRRVAAGVTSVGAGVFQGLSGLITTPIHEVQQHGGSAATAGTALLRGVGKGIVGAVVKPTVGIADLAEEVSTGMRNTAEVFEIGETPMKPEQFTRFRPPRPAFSTDDDGGVEALKRYDRDLAFAFSLIDKEETYLHHARSVPAPKKTDPQPEAPSDAAAGGARADSPGQTEPEPEPEREAPELEPEPEPEPEKGQGHTRFRALAAGVIRAGPQLDSPKAEIQKLNPGQVIAVTERQTVGRQTRLRFAGGWVSETAKNGKVLLERLDDEPEPEPEPEPNPKPEQPVFIAAPEFGGARDGFAFKSGPRGTGYYLLAAEQPEYAVAEGTEGVHLFLATLGHSARTKGVVQSLQMQRCEAGNWVEELIDMKAAGKLDEFLSGIGEDAEAGVESFVMITDTRVLVFPDVEIAPEVYTQTLVKDVRSLKHLEDGLELLINSGDGGTKTVRLTLPPDEVATAGQSLAKVLSLNR